MGKFYLENRHLWERVRRVRAHEEALATGGGLGEGTPVDESIEVRFEYHVDGKPPSCVRLFDVGSGPVRVEAGNAYVGLLDAASSSLIREIFREHPGLGHSLPAVLVDRPPIGRLWTARLGVPGD